MLKSGSLHNYRSDPDLTVLCECTIYNMSKHRLEGGHCPPVSTTVSSSKGSIMPHHFQQQQSTQEHNCGYSWPLHQAMNTANNYMHCGILQTCTKRCPTPLSETFSSVRLHGSYWFVEMYLCTMGARQQGDVALPVPWMWQQPLKKKGIHWWKRTEAKLILTYSWWKEIQTT